MWSTHSHTMWGCKLGSPGISSGCILIYIGTPPVEHVKHSPIY